ncbi:DUF2905 domain-containing protein [Fulvivirga sp. 2943]|uniref:DUF2905 domain-containing protein n=2 Tax=Fulvivirga sediminis TaxID=2803949 RepID=A0A937F457_9BACT|nr:DUF2905 domain-containing protein [Fulvivirga sediminis]
MAKFLIIIGVILVIIGMILHFEIKIPFLGKLPGDIDIKRENFRFYFPVMSSIILSVLLSLIVFIIQKLKG